MKDSSRATTGIANLDPRFRSLFRIGAWTALAQALTVVFAIVGYFIWPYAFSDHDAAMVLSGIQRAPAEYFMRLDPIVLLGTLLQLPVWLALWVALRKVDPGEALLGLAAGTISTVASLTIRPIIELYALADRFAMATTLEERNNLASAGEALLAQFHGTAWAISIMCGGAGGMIFGHLMRKTSLFRPATAWTMLLSGFGALLVLVPKIGILSLFVLGTLVGLVASVLCGLDLLRGIPKDSTAGNPRQANVQP